jgi:hypothetical protein
MRRLALTNRDKKARPNYQLGSGLAYEIAVAENQYVQWGSI